MKGSVALLYWSAERLPDGRLGMVLIKLLRFQDFGAVENSLAVARSFHRAYGHLSAGRGRLLCCIEGRERQG